MKPIDSKTVKKFNHNGVWINNVTIYIYCNEDEDEGYYDYITIDENGNKIDSCGGFSTIEGAYDCAGIKIIIYLKNDN